MTESQLEPLSTYRELPIERMRQRAEDFLSEMKKRRTVRNFSSRPVPREIIEDCIRTAMTAPNGANMQPWYFAVIQDPSLKRKLRDQAEKVEHDFYHGRAPVEWLEALEPLGTDEHKLFLEDAPYLIVVFAQLHGLDEAGESVKHYYVNESVGIATGLLIAAIHHAGLVSLTHTPSPMRFLNQVLNRPDHEKPFLILAVGYPSEDAQVPKITKKRLEEVSGFF